MVEAATEFVKSGYSEEDSAQLAYVASLYQNVADEALTAGESANYIISQLKAFNLEVSDSQHLVDALNEVSNNFAVSSSDLGNNLGKVSAALAVGNNTYEQTLGLMTGIIEITRSGSRAARSLVTVQSRLNQIVDESSDTGKALTEWYNKHNIAIYDQEGQLRSLYDILSDVAEIWPDLTTNEKDYYLNQQAGANQTVNLAAALSNFKTVADATNTALNSTNSAVRENEAVMDSLSARVNAVKAAFQELALDVIDSELVKSILELTKDFLELADSGVGQFIIKFGLLTGLLTGGISLLGQFGTGLASTVGTWGKLIKVVSESGGLFTAIKSGAMGAALGLGSAGTAATGASVGFAALSATALPIAGILAAVAAAGVLVYKAYKNITKPLSDYTQELDNSTSQLESNKKRLDELNAIPWYDRTKEINDEISALEAENKELERQIKLQRKNQLVKAKKDVAASVEYQERGYAVSRVNPTAASNYSVTGLTPEEAMRRYGIGKGGWSLKTVEDEIEKGRLKIEEALVDVSVSSDEAADKFIANAQRVLEASKQGIIDEEAQFNVNQLISAMQDKQIPALQLLDEEYKSTGQAVEGYGEKQQRVLELYNELLPLLQQVSEEQDEAESTTNALDGVVSTYTKALSDATQKYQNLSSILETVNQQLDNDANWQLPVETLNEINSLLPDAVGQITNATEAQQVLQNAIIDTENTATQAYANMMLSNGDFVAGVIQNSATLQAVLNQNYGTDFNNWKDLDSSKLTADTQLLNKLATMWSKYMGMTKQQIQAQVNSFKQFSSYLSENDRKELQAMESYLAYLEEAEKGMKDLTFSPTGVGTGGDDKTVKKAGSTPKKTTDAYKEAFDEWLAYKDHQLAMDEITEEEYYTALKQKNEEYFGGKKEYLDEYRKYAEKVYDWEKKQAEEQAKAAKEAYEKYLDDIKSKLDAVISYVTEYASRQIEALEKQIDAIDDEIDAVNDKYDAKIDALDEQNAALEKQIQLEQYLEALARAKSTQKLVFKDGQFQYQGDVDAISAAQGDIDAFNREQALQDKKNQIEQERQNELTRLENSKSALEQEKERWQEYKDGWANLSSDYEYYQNELIAKQVLGIDLENSNWDARLGNFNSFNQMYGQYQQMLLASQQETADGEASIWNQRLADACDFMNQYAAIMGTGMTYGYTPVGGSGASPGTSKAGGFTNVGSTESLFDPADLVEPGTLWEFGDETHEGYAGKWSSDVDYGTEIANALARGASWEEINNLVHLRNQKIADLGLEGDVEKTSELWRKIRDSVGAHASGTLSARGGLSLVGEQGPELRVLSSGDGILPNDITSNLWNWGSISPSQLLQGLASTTNQSMVFNIDNLSLPNVSNGETFLGSLKQLAYQRAYKRA